MEKMIINPKKIHGSINIPPSKSMAHRAIICAALCKGKSTISNIEYSDDIIATINAMRNLGARIDTDGDKLFIDGTEMYSKNGGVIDCNESGSTLRFLVPISIAKNNEIKFIGKGNLGKRPLNIYYDIFNKQGIEYSYTKDVLNLDIKGELKGGIFEIPGDISSQFISGLLFTLPILKEDSKIIIKNNLESKGYIDLTLSMLRKYGIEIVNNDYKEFIIKGNQEYKTYDYRVEGDYSQAAFYLCADAIGNNVVSMDLDEDSLQGDKEIIDILRRMNCNILNKDNGIKVECNDLKSTIIDASQCPDVIPVLTVVAALSEGETKILNAIRLRIKECDRLHAITSELNKLGANITELEDSMIIQGVKEFNGGEVDSFDDHRIAMALAIASTRCKEKVIIKNPKCVSKSYPSFWEDFKMLGGECSEWNLGQ